MSVTTAADGITEITTPLNSKVVTYDFARLMEGATEVKCSEFGTALVKNMEKL